MVSELSSLGVGAKVSEESAKTVIELRNTIERLTNDTKRKVG